MSCTGYVLTYLGCPLLWCSRLQTEIALRTTEVEYIALIQAMHKLINFTSLMKEASFIFYIHLPKLEFFCKVFEDDQSCIAVAEHNIFSLRTKHIANKYHHLQRSTQKKIIWICFIDT